MVRPEYAASGYVRYKQIDSGRNHVLAYWSWSSYIAAQEAST
jgi:hypothetical protein